MDQFSIIPITLITLFIYSLELLIILYHEGCTQLSLDMRQGTRSTISVAFIAWHSYGDTDSNLENSRFQKLGSSVRNGHKMI